MSSNRQLIFPGLIIFLTLLTRFIGLNWGDGLFYQPDENNMATAIVQLGRDGLNPHFFAYGQFPLYLSYFSLRGIGLPVTIATATYTLRFYSAIFSIISIGIFYQIIRRLADSAIVAQSAALLYVFTPGLIQLAHFGTTESLLVLVFLINIYLASILQNNPLSLPTYLWAALINGVALGSKLSAAVLIYPLFLVTLVNLVRYRFPLRLIFYGTAFTLFTLIIFIITSPYNLIAQKDFLSAFSYESGVATGRIQMFYTNQFLNTPAYLFPVQKIFPYAIGLPILALSFPGLYFIFKTKNKFLLTTILSSVLIYFLYFGQLYVKWTRFMSPIFFILPLLGGFTIAALKSRKFKYLLLSLSIIPGLMFTGLYLAPDIRTVASDWMIANLHPDAKILSEAGNVVNIPVGPHAFAVYNFDFYNLDSQPELARELVSQIFQSDYILVPSRRIFKNQHGPRFPVSEKYYQALFGGSLGFHQIVEFSPHTDLLLNPENAEETWSVFDRPTIRLFKKTKQLTIEEVASVLNIKN